MRKYGALVGTLLAGLALGMTLIAPGANAASAEQTLDQEARAALKSLYSQSSGARALGEKAKGILVFPNVTKAGPIIGGQGGDGILMIGGKTTAYYNTSAASIGLQAGAQKFGYALFFMSDAELKSFQTKTSFEIGVGPNIVVVDAGAAKDINTLTGKADVYAIIFDQKGLMAGIGIQGSKITKLNR